MRSQNSAAGLAQAGGREPSQLAASLADAQKQRLDQLQPYCNCLAKVENLIESIFLK